MCLHITKVCDGKHDCVMFVYFNASNKDQKLVGCFTETRLLIAVPLKMYRKFDQPKWILVRQMVKLIGNGQWPTVISSTDTYNYTQHTFIYIYIYIKNFA